MLKEKLREYEEKQANIPENPNAAVLSNNQQAEIQRYIKHVTVLVQNWRLWTL